jgi:hypothetical protein
MVGWLLLLLACSAEPIPNAEDRLGLVRALRLISADPEAAAAACQALGPSVRGDCLTAAVETAPAHHAAASWCDSLSGIGRDECHFQRAERTRSHEACGRAGRFADDCRLHVWAAGMSQRWPAGTPMDAGIASVRTQMSASGIDPTDLRFWSATFRYALLLDPPFDRGRCDTVGEAVLKEACARTGLGVYEDLLNRARDSGTFPCDGGPLPPPLQYARDAEIDAILARRHAHDLCGER